MLLNRTLLFLIFFSSTLDHSVHAQTGYLKELFGTTLFKEMGIIPFDDGSFIIGPNPLFKVDSAGNILWAKEFQDPPDSNTSFSLPFMKDNHGRIVTQYKEDIICFDSSGNLLWSKRYLPAYTAPFLADDGSILLLSSRMDSLFRMNISILKTDSAGNPIWCKSFGIDSIMLWPRNIMQTSDGGYLVHGYYPSISLPYYRVVTIKLDHDGNVLHAYTIRQGESYHGKFFEVSENKYLLPGDGTMMCFDSTGALVWIKMQSIGYWRGGVVGRNHHLYFTGEVWDTLYTYLYSNTSFEIDTLGNILQCVRYTNSDSIGMYLIDTLMGGSFISLGSTFSGRPLLLKSDYTYFNPCYDYHPTFFDSLISDSSIAVTDYTLIDTVFVQSTSPVLLNSVVKDSLWCEYTVNVSSEPNPGMDLRIYPNPATSQFRVSSNEMGEAAMLEIFNMLGEKIYSEELNSSEPTTVHCEQLQKGFYLARVVSERGQAVLKLIIR